VTKTQESNEILMHSLDPQQTRGSTLAAKTEISNPVTAYLAELVWDGVPRLDRWLVDYAETCGSKLERSRK
jgi:predicted P-loop ATPase